MDVATLLYRNRPATVDDFRRKSRALRSGYSLVKTIEPDMGIDQFISWAGDVVSRVYGAPAQDAYLTTVMSVIRAVQPHVDTYLGAVLNNIVLQMNFQTRRFTDGTEGVIFEGASDLFPIAMMHGNETMGLHLIENPDAPDLPKWTKAGAALEVNPGQTHRVVPGRVLEYLAAGGVSHIGAILIADPSIDMGSFSVHDRYSYIADKVSPHTIYCVAGAAEMVIEASRQLQALYPDARVNLRAYTLGSQGALRHRAALVVSGLPELPAITIKPGFTRECTFGYDRSRDTDREVKFFSYAEGHISGQKDIHHYGDEQELIGEREAAPVRRPFYLSSSAPLPLEARRRISDGEGIYHSVAGLKSGIVIPSPDSSVYLHAAGSGAIVTDYGVDFKLTPMYRDGWTDDADVRHGTLQYDDLIRVKGAGMPLQFTPLLHKWHSHFMIQCLPRVRVIRDMGEDISMLVPHDLRAKQLEMLAILGFGEDRIVRMPPRALVQADMLYVPRPWSLSFSPYSTEIYNEIKAKVAKVDAPTPKRILISRESRKSWRNLLNYEAIREMLVDNYNFEVVAPEKLSLAEEVATYGNAEIVVGAEGAGMYGAVFSGPGTSYLTLCDEDYVMPILSSLAHVQGFDIGYVFGESMRADSDVARRLSHGHADFVVDVERVEKAVQHTIAQGKSR